MKIFLNYNKKVVEIRMEGKSCAAAVSESINESTYLIFNTVSRVVSTLFHARFPLHE